MEPVAGNESVRDSWQYRVYLQKKESEKGRIKIGLFIIWIALLVLYIQSYYKIGTPLLPPHLSLKILLRSLIIVFAWIVIVGPVLRYLLHRWLQKQKYPIAAGCAAGVGIVAGHTGTISGLLETVIKKKGLRRVYAFCKRVLVNALQPAGTEVYIVTAPIQSGKTTSLINWAAGRQDVQGVLTPVVDGKRFFMNAATGVTFAMEAAEGDQDLLKVGRFVFSKEGFDKAIQLIRDAKQSAGWLIIDEIGPMELRGEGFHDVLKEVLATPMEGRKIIIVIRKGLWEDVIKHFGIDKSILWSPTTTH